MSHSTSLISVALMLVALTGCATRPAEHSDLRELLADREQYPVQGTALERCLATQERRERGCAELGESQQAACFEDVAVMKSACSDLQRQLDPGATAIACTGTCVSTACSPLSPCTITPTVVCSSGSMCTARPAGNTGPGNYFGEICSPGTICDCICKTTYFRMSGTCSCGCEW